MTWRRPRWLCPHTQIDEIYDKKLYRYEDGVAGDNRVDYTGHCGRCDTEVTWHENI